MPQAFTAIPDWFSWENQGAGIAVAGIGGEQHLVVLMVDGAPEQTAASTASAARWIPAAT